MSGPDVTQHDSPIILRTAFTLVEVLVVLIILSLMGGMVVVAVRGVTQSAREARTRSIIAAIDSVIRENYESYKYRPLAVEIPDTFVAANFSSPAEIGFEVLASEAARVRLMMVRDLQRMEIPDRLSDIDGDPLMLRAAASPVVVDSTGKIAGTRDNPALRRIFGVSWYTNTNNDSPGKLAAIKSRLPTGFNSTSDIALSNQGAECLYLIMATSFVGGTPAIDTIPSANIGDTDEDGLLEILDAWGNPLCFIRWPVGYYDATGSTNTTVPDDFDLFRSDYAYFVDPASSPPAIPLDVTGATQTTALPWSIRPLIASAGPDGEFGIATNPWRDASDSDTEDADFGYTSTAWNWPLSAAYFGTELAGRDRSFGSSPTTYTSHSFIDPYLRRYVALNGGSSGFAGLLPGQALKTETARQERSDNISNFELEVTQ